MDYIIKLGEYDIMPVLTKYKNDDKNREIVNYIFSSFSPEFGGERVTQKLREYFVLQLTQPQLSKKACAQLAGYKNSTTPVMIEHTKAYKTIRERIEIAAQQTDVTPHTVFSTLKRSMDRSKLFIDGSRDTSANQAAKIAGEFLGMTAPVEIAHNITMQQQALIGILDLIPPTQPEFKSV